MQTNVLSPVAALSVTDRHTAVDYAHVFKDLADMHFSDARTIVRSRTISTSTARRHQQF